MSAAREARSALVTGASTGLGFQIARHLASQGWRVFAGVRSPADEPRVRALHPTRVIPLRIDVTARESIVEARDAIAEATADRGLDALINNAGIAVAGPVEGVPLDDWRRQFEVNVFGAVATTQVMLPLLRLAKGRIIMISSISGLVSYPMLGPYAASKHALEAVSDSLRLELAREGIAVTVVEPGEIATPIWEKSLRDAERRREQWSPGMQERYAASIAMLVRSARRSASTAADASEVCRAVQHALTVARPPPRLLAGRGARIGWLLAKLPSRWLDRMILRTLERED